MQLSSRIQGLIWVSEQPSLMAIRVLSWHRLSTSEEHPSNSQWTLALLVSRCIPLHTRTCSNNAKEHSLCHNCSRNMMENGVCSHYLHSGNQGALFTCQKFAVLQSRVKCFFTAQTQNMSILLEIKGSMAAHPLKHSWYVETTDMNKDGCHIYTSSKKKNEGTLFNVVSSFDDIS